MNAQEYFRDEDFLVYRYLLRIRLPWPSQREEERYLDHKGNLTWSEGELLRERRARRKYRREKAARRVLKLCGPRSVLDVENAVFAFMKSERGRSFRSRERAEIMQEIFSEAIKQNGSNR